MVCLGIPCLVVEVSSNGFWAVVENGGVTSKVGTHLVGPVSPGDYLLVHAGYAVEVLAKVEAEARLHLWEELSRAGPG